MKTEAWMEVSKKEEVEMGRDGLHEQTDLKYMEWRLIGSKNVVS